MTTTDADPATTAPAAPSPAVRTIVAAGAVLAVLGAAWGSGAFGGTPIQDAADGALAADATLLAPATPAFGIWSVIYAGLLAFAALQAFPGTGASPRVRAAAWPVLAAMVLNAAWIAVVQQGWLWASVGVIVAIVATLGWAVARLARRGPRDWREALALDLPVGLYLGWASVATVANVTAAAGRELGAAPGDGTYAAMAALAAVGLLAIAMVRDLGPAPVLAWSITAALAWGVAWIGSGRLEDAPADLLVGWTALAVAAGIVLAAAVTTAVAAIRARRAR